MPHPYRRDRSSNALLNTNKEAAEAYKKRRDNTQSILNDINSLNERLLALEKRITLLLGKNLCQQS